MSTVEPLELTPDRADELREKDAESPTTPLPKLPMPFDTLLPAEASCLDVSEGLLASIGEALRLASETLEFRDLEEFREVVDVASLLETREHSIDGVLPLLVGLWEALLLWFVLELFEVGGCSLLTTRLRNGLLGAEEVQLTDSAAAAAAIAASFRFFQAPPVKIHVSADAALSVSSSSFLGSKSSKGRRPNDSARNRADMRTKRTTSPNSKGMQKVTVSSKSVRRVSGQLTSHR